MSKNKDPTSLINLQRDYIMSQIKGLQQPGSLYVLIMDERMESVVMKVLTKDQLLRVVAAVEKLDGRRKQQTYMEAIYLMDITIYNLKCILGDIQTSRYKAGHGLFLPILSNEQSVSQFYNGNTFLRNPKISGYFNGGGNIRYITYSMHPIESRVFLPDEKSANSMAIYFNENCSELVIPQIKQVAKSMVNLMVLLGEYPLIRFYSRQDSHHQATRLCELIADEFQNQIDNYARLNHDYPPPSIQGKPRSILLICDRTLDLFAPLLHEFTYQAMAMDIVESLEKTGKFRYKSENEMGEINEVEVELENEDDDDWVNLRHLHIIESSELIVNKISELIKNNPLLIDRSKATTSSDLMHVVAHLKGFDKERKQITLHRTLIDECLDINTSRKLAEFAADFEQTCAAKGISFEGEKNKTLHDDLIVLLARDDLHINDKMRLILIYGLYRGGLVESDFVKLVKFVGVNDRHIISLISKCFTNLYKLGFPIVKQSVKDKKVERKMFHQINNEGTYNTSRFIPALKIILQNASRYQLDEEWFPYFRDKPLEEDTPVETRPGVTSNPSSATLRNHRIKASWAQSSNKISLNLSSNRQKIFCFIAGGITYSEMRSIYELSASTNKDFYLGSDAILRPRDFLIGLQSIDIAKSLNELDLKIHKDLTKPSEPPLHLFESDRPKNVAPVAPHKNSHPYSSQANGSLPQHYQKRSSVNSSTAPSVISSVPGQFSDGSQSANSSDPTGSKDKEKKRFKLKKLFK